MLPKRRSALVLPVKRSSIESCSDILDLRAEHKKKFKGDHQDDVSSPTFSIDDLFSRQSDSKPINDNCFTSLGARCDDRAADQRSIKLYGGRSESFASFQQMFSHLSSASRYNTSSNVSLAERPRSVDVSHPTVPPAFVFSSFTPSASLDVHNSLLHPGPQNLLDLTNHKASKNNSISEKMQMKSSSDFQTPGVRNNEVVLINDNEALSSCVIVTENINVQNGSTENDAGESKLSSSDINSTTKSSGLSNPLNFSLDFERSSRTDKLTELYKCEGNKAKAQSENQIHPGHHNYQSPGQQQTQQDFTPNFLQSGPHFHQCYVQNLVGLYYQNEFQKFIRQGYADPKLAFLLHSQTRLPWQQPLHHGSVLSNAPNLINSNLSSNPKPQTIPKHQAIDESRDGGPQNIDFRSKIPSSSWGETSKSNVWLMMGHGNTCFACGRSFTSKGSFRYHLSRCHILSGINTR